MVRQSATGTLLTCLLLLWSSHAFALDPTLDINQYAHKSWKIREGFLDGIITCIALTPDGYLWLGTELGLFRFDGIRSIPWKSPAAESLPSNYVRSLLVARDGTLWIGTLEGLSSFKDGRLTPHTKLAGFTVDALLEDRQGTIWAGGQSMPYGRLCAVDANGSAACHGDDGIFGRYVESVYEDHEGNLWVGTHRGLWQWKPEPLRRLAMQEPISGPQSLLEDDNGSLIIRSELGLTRLIHGKFVKRGSREPAAVVRMLRDHNGGLWFGIRGKGLLHVHNKGRTDAFTPLDGLSGNSVSAFFEDREGNIWVATPGGLDRFRDSTVTTISAKQGLSSDKIWSVLAANDGSVWLTTRGGLNIIHDGEISHHADTKRDDLITSLFQDDGGRIWATRIGKPRKNKNAFS